MADTIKTGALGTEALLSTNVKPDVSEILKVLEPYRRPFTSYLFLSKKKGQVVNSQYAKFEWFEKRFYPHYTNVALAITLTSGTLVLTATNVGNKAVFGLYDIVKIEEGNQMAYVSSVTAGGGSDVVLTHIDGSTTLVALTDTTKNIRIIGTRVFETTDGLDAKTLQEVNYYNYLNEFRRYVDTTGRQEAGKAWTDGLTHADLVEQKIKEMQLEVERYFFFANARGYATSGNARTTYGFGLDGYLSTNVNNYSGALQEDVFRNHIQDCLARNTSSGRAIHFAGSDQMAEIEKFMRDYYRVVQTPKELGAFESFGATPKTFQMFSGTVTLVWNPVLDLAATNSGYTIDDAHIKLRYMAPDNLGARKFSVRTVTDPKRRGTTTEILMDVGLMVEFEETHGKLVQA